MIKTEIENEIYKLNKKYNDKKIKLHKEYWISEWSYDPLYEGYDVYKGVITKVKEINGYKVYYTDKIVDTILLGIYTLQNLKQKI